jgi:hypothetical protein
MTGQEEIAVRATRMVVVPADVSVAPTVPVVHIRREVVVPKRVALPVPAPVMRVVQARPVQPAAGPRSSNERNEEVRYVAA